MEVAARVWCVAAIAKHPLSPKEATALTEALAIHFSLTVAADDVTMTRRANKVVGSFVKDEALLKSVCQVCTDSLQMAFAYFLCNAWVLLKK